MNSMAAAVTLSASIVMTGAAIEPPARTLHCRAPWLTSCQVIWLLPAEQACNSSVDISQHIQATRQWTIRPAQQCNTWCDLAGEEQHPGERGERREKQGAIQPGPVQKSSPTGCVGNAAAQEAVPPLSGLCECTSYHHIRTTCHLA